MRTRSILNIISILCVLSVGFALFTQYYWDMRPCAWCVLARLIFILIFIFAVVFNFFSSHGAKKFGTFMTFVLAVLGVIATVYQYTVANKSFSCVLTLADKIVSQWLGLDKLLPEVFGIYASCLDASVDLFGIEYVLWALMVFALIALLSLAGIFSKRRLPNRALFK